MKNQRIVERIAYEKEFFDRRAIDYKDYNLTLKRDYSNAFYLFGIDPAVLSGKKVLDCGCGYGNLSIWLATKGAIVSSIDVSPNSLEILKKRAEFCRVSSRIKGEIMEIEELQYEDNSFDLIVGEMVLHHAVIDKAMPEIYRVLKRGGRAIFHETCGNNKILILCRRFLVGRLGIPKYQDEIEYPIRHKDIQKINNYFKGNCKLHYVPFVFWAC